MGSGATKPAVGAGIPAPTSNPNIFVEFDEGKNFFQYWVRPGTVEYETLLENHFLVRAEEYAMLKMGYDIKDPHDFCKEAKFIENTPCVEENENRSDEEEYFDEERNSDSSDGGGGGNFFSGLFSQNRDILPISHPFPVKDSDADDVFNFQNTGDLEETITMHAVPVASTVRNRLNPQPPPPVVEMESHDPAAPGIYYYNHLPPQWSGWMVTRFKAFLAMCRWSMVKEFMFETGNRNGFHFDSEKRTQRQKAVATYFTYTDTFMHNVDNLFKVLDANKIADPALQNTVINIMEMHNQIKVSREQLQLSQPSSKN